MSKWAVTRARLRLFDAIEAHAHARAEASWCHGYRAAGKDYAEIQKKEAAWWERVSLAKVELERALRFFTKTVRENAGHNQ